MSQKKELTSKDYLENCFMQQCENEINAYYKDEEGVLDKYSKLSIKYMPLISLGVSSSLVLLYSPLSLKASSQLIGLFVLIFITALMLITRYYIKHKENVKLRLELYDCWKKSIFGAIIVNFGLYIFSSSPHVEMLTIISLATGALIYIQSGIKRSLLSL